MQLPKYLTTVTTFSKILAGLLFITLPLVGFYLGMQYQKNILLNSEKIIDNNINNTNTALDDDLIYLSYVEVGGKVYLKYDDKIYTEDTPYDIVQEAKLDNQEELEWKDILSIYQRNNNFLFSFKQLNNSNSFIFVIETAPELLPPQAGYQNYHYPTYLVFKYTPNDEKRKLTHLLSSSHHADDTDYFVTKTDSISPDNKYLSLNALGCWGCGGHTPEKILVDLDKHYRRSIGKTADFKWGTDGNYLYKEYIEKECYSEDQGKYTCSEEPNKLPFKNGNFQTLL